MSDEHRSARDDWADTVGSIEVESSDVALIVAFAAGLVAGMTTLLLTWLL